MISRRSFFRSLATGVLAGAAYLYAPSVLRPPRVTTFEAFNHILIEHYLPAVRDLLNSERALTRLLRSKGLAVPPPDRNP